MPRLDVIMEDKEVEVGEVLSESAEELTLPEFWNYLEEVR